VSGPAACAIPAADSNSASTILEVFSFMTVLRLVEVRFGPSPDSEPVAGKSLPIR
jgi:hypothetical protein